MSLILSISNTIAIVILIIIIKDYLGKAIEPAYCRHKLAKALTNALIIFDKNAHNAHMDATLEIKLTKNASNENVATKPKEDK